MHIARTRRRTCRLECARRARVLGEHPDRVGATHRNPSVRCKKHAAGFRNAIGSCDDYIYGPGTTPVEQVSLATSTATFMTYTPSDCSWLITNAAGDEVVFYGYDAFGNLAFGTPTSPFGYAGQYTDPSTGFSNMRARWYEPQTANFTTRDRAFAATDTAYTYAGDDPVNRGDPTGTYTLGICGGLAGEIEVFVGGGGSIGACAFLGERGWLGQITSLALSETGSLSAFGAGIGGNAFLGFQVSTAANPHDLTGDFNQVSVTAAFGFASGSLDVFWGRDKAGQLVLGANIGWAPGAEFGDHALGDVHLGATATSQLCRRRSARCCRQSNSYSVAF